MEGQSGKYDCVATWDSKVVPDDIVSMGYFVMPKYDMNLLDYIKHFKGEELIKRTLEVAC